MKKEPNPLAIWSRYSNRKCAVCNKQLGRGNKSGRCMSHRILPKDWYKHRKLPLGSNNQSWKGDKVGYRGLHKWIKRWLGAPVVCVFCKAKKTTPKSIHWANKSHTYKRSLNDWMSLCVKCHKSYDIEYRKEIK